MPDHVIGNYSWGLCSSSSAAEANHTWQSEARTQDYTPYTCLIMRATGTRKPTFWACCLCMHSDPYANRPNLNGCTCGAKWYNVQRCRYDLKILLRDLKVEKTSCSYMLSSSMAGLVAKSILQRIKCLGDRVASLLYPESLESVESGLNAPSLRNCRL